MPEGGAASPRAFWTFSSPAGLRGSPSLADLDGDGSLETVVSADGLGLAVLGADGSLRWTYSFPSTIVTTPLLADIDSDGQTELLAGTEGGALFAISSGRDLLWTFSADGPVSSDMTAADLDGDGRAEVVFATARGTVAAVGADGRERWRFPAGSAVRGCLPAADFDLDGLPEVAVGTSGGRLILLGRGGAVLWNVSAGAPLTADPAVADLDLDGRPDVVAGTAGGNMTAFASNGTLLWTFPAGGSVNSSIAVADQDGDGRPEVLAGCDDGRLYCLSPDGRLEWSYYCAAPAGPPSPFRAGRRCQVAFPAADGRVRLLDDDRALLASYAAAAVPRSTSVVACLVGGDVPALVVNCEDRAVRCFPLVDIPTMEWRTRQHDSRRTGSASASPEGSLPGSIRWRIPLLGIPDGPPAAADTDGDGRAEVAVATTGGALYLVNGTSGAVRWRFDTGATTEPPSAPLLADIDGDGRPEAAWAGPDGALRAFWPSNGTVMWRQDLGIRRASPAAGDIDGDGRMEIAIGTDAGQFFVLDGAGGAVERAEILTDGVQEPAALADLGGGPALEAVVSTAGSVMAVRNGTALWTSPGAVFLPSAPLMCDLNSDGIPEAVVGTGRGELCAFSGTNGHLLWNISVGAAVTEPPVMESAGFNSILLAASLSDGSLVRVQGRTAAVLWKAQAGAATSLSIADIDLDGRNEILVGTGTGLDAFNANGALLWRFPVNGGVRSTPVVVDADLDGSLEVVFGGRDGCLYSLSAGGRCAPGAAPWPTYRHDNRRTGNALAGGGRFLPDLEVGPESVRCSPPFPDEGGTVQVNVTVRNIGAADSPAFSVSLIDNGTPVDSPQYGLGLDAGAGRMLTFQWTPQGGDHLLGVEVDSGGAVAELREDNNAASRSVRVNFRPVAAPGRDMQVEVGETALFDGTGSRDPDGVIAEYRWSFGDGASAGGAAPVHRYLSPGRFTVTLEVTDDSGAAGSGSLQVSVNGPPRITDRSPASDVTMSENETREFSVSAADPEGDPFTVLWRLDRSEAGSGTRFTYVPDFASAGNHTLAAEVSDGSRTVGTAWNITVRDSQPPILSHRPAWRNVSAGPGENVSFGIELGSVPVSVRWYLDGAPVDGAHGTELRLAPSAAGSYLVAVAVNASGHLDRREWLLQVVRRNSAPFFERLEPAGDRVLMLSRGTQEFLAPAGDRDGGAPSVQWYLDGAALLNETGPAFVFVDGGGRARANVTVVASDGELTALHSWNVRVNSPPVALFSASRRNAAVKEPVAFNASASFDADGNVTSYTWSFGDGSPPAAGGASASHSFQRPGVYVVELAVADDLGATAVSVQAVAVVRAAEGLRAPAPGAPAALAAVAVLALLEGVFHRRRKARHQRD
jgi:outer membrane protein assembly factor BamB/chitodextrinase